MPYGIDVGPRDPFSKLDNFYIDEGILDLSPKEHSYDPQANSIMEAFNISLENTLTKVCNAK